VTKIRQWGLGLFARSCEVFLINPPTAQPTRPKRYGAMSRRIAVRMLENTMTPDFVTLFRLIGSTLFMWVLKPSAFILTRKVLGLKRRAEATAFAMRATAYAGRK
jgi:hypothetical protein